MTAIRGARILLADDNAFNQQVACEFLQDAGAHVEAASNGKEALDWLNKASFDCVLMDVQMPVMDGLEATRQIRANKALAKLPVIAMTANARAEDRQRCSAAGMNDFLSKPIAPAQLYATLGKWLKHSLPASTPALQQCADASGCINPPHTFIESMLSSDPAIIDLSVLAKMMDDDPGKIHKFAHKFLEAADKTMLEIEEALARGDMTTLATLGHRMKSAARAVGAMGFAEHCQALEHHDSDYGLEQANETVCKLRALLEQIRKQISIQLA